MNILVVGEAPAERSPTVRSLARARPDYRVSVAENAGEALRQLEECCFDLVLVDSEMDHKEDVLRRRNARAENLPHLLVVGNQVTPEAEREAIRLGAAKMVGRNAGGLEELFRTADRLWELRRLRDRQELLLYYLGDDDVVGPCSTGGERYV